MEQPSWEEKKGLMESLQEKHLDIEQDRQESVSVVQEEIESRSGLNQKEEELLKRVEKLELVEQNLDEEIKQPCQTTILTSSTGAARRLPMLMLCFVRVCLYVLRGHLLGKG